MVNSKHLSIYSKFYPEIYNVIYDLNMQNIPYIPQPDSMSCALACYTMVAKYFFPEMTLEDVAKISNWQKGYVVWAYKFWLWIMDQGIKITEYDLIDSETWANEGIEGLKKSVSENEFNFYMKNTRNIESYSGDIKRVLAHSNFTYIRKKPTFEILEKALLDDKICEVVLDSKTLKDREGFSLHRVVVLGIEDGKIYFNDPAEENEGEASKEKFKTAWLTAVKEPELCIYEKI